QVAPQPLAIRIFGEERLELADELRSGAELEVGFDPELEGLEAQLVQSGACTGERSARAEVASTREGRSAPQLRRRARRPRRPLRAVRAALARVRDVALESDDVDGLGRDVEPVAGLRSGDHGSRPERRAEARDRDLDGRGAALRLLIRPELV